MNSMPVQQPIPLWFGGNADAVLRRAARLGDGWMPNWRTPDEARPEAEKLRGYLSEAGRKGASFGLEARIPYGVGTAERWERLLEGWRALGATHASVNTMGSGFKTPEDHMAALERPAHTVPPGAL
jgi:alkanesulfonate monooxygenase SsuD/methylene tetrahydromethanopterin reductase-like flavin-dependent oxidoreductase (luciferase family)